MLSDGQWARRYCAQAQSLGQEREVSPNQWLSEEANGKTRSWQNGSRAFSVLFLSSFQKLGANEIHNSSQEQGRQGPEQDRTPRLTDLTHLPAGTAVSQTAQTTVLCKTELILVSGGRNSRDDRFSETSFPGSSLIRSFITRNPSQHQLKQKKQSSSPVHSMAHNFPRRHSTHKEKARGLSCQQPVLLQGLAPC